MNVQIKVHVHRTFVTPVLVNCVHMHQKENIALEIAANIGKCKLAIRKLVAWIDNSHYRLILKLGKEMWINHHSYIEHTKISKIAKFGCEMLQNAENIALQSLQILYTFQVISCSYFSQSALRKGCPNRNPFWCIQSIISFIILYETSWNFVIMFGYENYSSDKNMESK
jgi:hypothetical protein